MLGVGLLPPALNSCSFINHPTATDAAVVVSAADAAVSVSVADDLPLPLPQLLLLLLMLLLLRYATVHLLCTTAGY